MLDRFTVAEISEVITVDSPAGRRFQMTDRPNYGLSFCAGGCIIYDHHGKQTVSDSAHAVLLPKGESYSLVCSEGGFFPLINFTCSEDPGVREILAFPLRNPEQYLKEYQKLRELYFLRKDRAGCMSILYGLLSDLAADGRSNCDPLSPAIDYLHDHLSDPNLSNQVLADCVGISEVYFRRLFRDNCGLTPRQYILDLRLRLARRLLTETRDAVGDIAAKCGFSSVYHFSRSFRQTTGCTPTEYRRKAGRWGI